MAAWECSACGGTWAIARTEPNPTDLVLALLVILDEVSSEMSESQLRTTVHNLAKQVVS